MANTPATDQLPERAPRSDERGARLIGPYSDRRLVARVRAGDEAAFERLFDRYAPGLVSFCRHMLGSREEAEDAVQQVFVSAHRALLASDREMHLRAWLYAIARNRCLSILRVRREELDLDDVDPSAVSTAGLAAEVEQREDLRTLLVDLQRLPDDQRAAIVLAELGAHTHEEIADVLGVRREKVKALVFQAREALHGARRARETPCADIREQLATARGSQLRRAELRRHLEVCPACREFREEVGRQHAAFVLLLPVVPTAALKASVLGGGAAATGAGAAGSGLLFGGAKGVTKLLATLALTGVAGGGGYVAVTELQGRSPDDAPPAQAQGAGPTSTGEVASEQASGGTLAQEPVGAAGAKGSPSSESGRGGGKRDRQAGRGDASSATAAAGTSASGTTSTTEPIAATPEPAASAPATGRQDDPGPIGAPGASGFAPGHAGGPARDAAPGHAAGPARDSAPGQVKPAPAPPATPAPAAPSQAAPAAPAAPAPAPAAGGDDDEHGNAFGHQHAPGQAKKDDD